MATSFFRLAELKLGWTKMRETKNSCGGSGWVGPAAFHSPIRIRNDVGTFLHEKKKWNHLLFHQMNKRNEHRLTYNLRLYVQQSIHCMDQLIRQNLEKHHRDPIKLLAMDMHRTVLVQHRVADYLLLADNVYHIDTVHWNSIVVNQANKWLAYRLLLVPIE